MSFPGPLPFSSARAFYGFLWLLLLLLLLLLLASLHKSHTRSRSEICVPACSKAPTYNPLLRPWIIAIVRSNQSPWPSAIIIGPFINRVGRAIELDHSEKDSNNSPVAHFTHFSPFPWAMTMISALKIHWNHSISLKFLIKFIKIILIHDNSTKLIKNHQNSSKFNLKLDFIVKNSLKSLNIIKIPHEIHQNH